MSNDADNNINNELWLERYAQSMIGVFGKPLRVLSHGEGSYVYDVDNNKYLDLLGGIAVNALGYAHPSITQAINDQAQQVMHVCNYFASTPQIKLAEKLLQITAAPVGSGVFFTNSGTEAVEAALKLTRLTGKTKVVALDNAFHGRSTGALALTHKPAFRAPFEPLIGDVTHVPFNNEEALVKLFADCGNEIAAMFIEPIQGEAGVYEVTDSYLNLARNLTEQSGSLLIFDEVQTGIGRTGTWCSFQRSQVVPDAVCLAKALGGGFPIGALVTFGKAVTEMFMPLQHGSTFGGNPLACAVGLAVINTIENEQLLDNVKLVGNHINSTILNMNSSRVAELRGAGLLIGIGLSDETSKYIALRALNAGFIINAANPNSIRLAPPLNLSLQEANLFLEALPMLLERSQI